MKIVKSTFFPIVPKSAMRATTDMFWLTQISEQAAVDLDNKWQQQPTKLGVMWVSMRKNKRGDMVAVARKSPPSYQRQRKYLIEQYENRKAITAYGESIDFAMPEDCFMIVVHFPMAKSWTKKKKAQMAWQRHKQRPDSDNIQKQLFDTLYYKKNRFARVKGDEDAKISSNGFVKVWVPDDITPGFYINEYLQSEWDLLFDYKMHTFTKHT